jgi:hypothetical protein
VGAIFRDAAHEAAFRRDGFLHRPFLDAAALSSLRASYEAIAPAATLDFHATSNVMDAAYRRRVFDGIRAAFQPAIDAFLDGYAMQLGSFMTKGPRSRHGEIPLHQDWSLVDPAADVEVNLWVPLVDTGPDNGGLAVVPGSHLALGFFGISSRADPPFAPIADRIWNELAVPLRIAAGEVAFYDARLLHGSGQNPSSERRAAAVAGTIPARCVPRLYHATASGPTTAEVFEVSADFMMTYAAHARPEGVPKIGEVDYPYGPLGAADLERLRDVVRALGYPAS